MSCSDRSLTIPPIVELLRVPLLKLASCFERYWAFWPPSFGNTSLELSPSAPWHRKQPPPTIFFARSRSGACANAAAAKAIVASTVIARKKGATP